MTIIDDQRTLKDANVTTVAALIATGNLIVPGGTVAQGAAVAVWAAEPAARETEEP